MAHVRTHVALALLALGLSWLGSAVAAAQSCHAPAVTLASEERFRVTLGTQVASYGDGEDDGGGVYQGLYAGFGYTQPWYALELLLPVYRLERRSETVAGLGDLVLTARGTALRTRDDVLTAGVELPVMVPTGSASKQLGMGHVMLMPAAWLALNLEPLVVRAQVGYGRMLGGGGGDDDGHAHHAGSDDGVPRSPIVNPMNRSELEHTLAVILGLQRALSVHARWLGAVPIADDDGVTRQTIAAGVTATLDRFDISLEGQRPVKGDAFDFKMLLQAAARF